MKQRSRFTVLVTDPEEFRKKRLADEIGTNTGKLCAVFPELVAALGEPSLRAEFHGLINHVCQVRRLAARAAQKTTLATVSKEKKCASQTRPS